MQSSIQRDVAVDSVRSIAILTMIGANFGSLLQTPHMVWFRYYSSFAAPLFVTLAGMMIAFSVIKAKDTASFSYVLKRGFFLIGCGAFLDLVVWGDYPFVSMEVLYLIGLGLPLAHLCASRTMFFNGILATIFIALSVLAQKNIGYTPEVLSIKFGESIELSSSMGIRVLKMWLFDGWFPLLPWLSYINLGVVLAKLRWHNGKTRSFARYRYLYLATSLLIAGVIAMQHFSTPLYERDGYAELFYPATPGFMSLSFGVIVLIFIFADMSSHFSLWRLLLPLGCSSLFIYLAHLILLEIIGRFVEDIGFGDYLQIYFATTIVMIISCLGLRKIKRAYLGMPVIMRWVIGA